MVMIRKATTRQLVRWQQQRRAYAFTCTSQAAISTSITTSTTGLPHRRTSPNHTYFTSPSHLYDPTHWMPRRWMSVVVTKTASSTDDEDDPVIVLHKTDTNTKTVAYQQLSDSLTVTQSCLDRIEHLISIKHNKKEEDSEEDLYFLRVFVDAGGCSGFQYQFEMDTEMDVEEDIVFVATADESKRPRVVVDEASLAFMEGSTLDYVQEMIRSSFVVSENPQSESACGCGSSFAMKNFAANPALD